MKRQRSQHGAPQGIELQKRVDRLARMVEQVEIALRRAERKIEADAEHRLRRLHTEARAQLLVLREHEREARRILLRLSGTGNASWGDLQRAADSALQKASKVSGAILERCRRVLSECPRIG
jgi:hypothetical protein